MRASFLSIIAGVIALLAVNSSALDLTAQQSFRTLEGVKIPVLHFKDGTRTIKYQPPGAWQIRDGSRRTVLAPPDAEQASVTLSVVPLKPSTGRPAPARTSPDLIEWAKTLLPAGTSDVELKSEVESPYTLNGLPSRELIFECVAQARRFAVSVSVVDFNETDRFVLVIVARQPDFQRIHSDAISSMFSWDWVK